MKAFFIKVITLIVCLILLVIAPKLIYFLGYRKLPLEKIGQAEYPMDTRLSACHYIVLNSKKALENMYIEEGIQIPDVDIETNTIIVAYGSELQSLKVNVFDSKIQNMHIGHDRYLEKEPKSMVYIYITKKIMLTRDIRVKP